MERPRIMAPQVHGLVSAGEIRGLLTHEPSGSCRIAEYRRVGTADVPPTGEPGQGLHRP